MSTMRGEVGFYESKDIPRLSAQAGSILALFRGGAVKVTNTEMAAIALQYNARIHELRKMDWDIRLVSRNRETGVSVYELVVPVEEFVL